MYKHDVHCTFKVQCTSPNITMPELPEVETIVRRLRADLIGYKIESADLLWDRTLVTPKPAHFKKNIVGQTIATVDRRAKYIVLTLNVDTLIIHLRMSGDILIREESVPIHKHDRLILHLSPPKPLFPPPSAENCADDRASNKNRHRGRRLEHLCKRSFLGFSVGYNFSTKRSTASETSRGFSSMTICPAPSISINSELGISS